MTPTCECHDVPMLWNRDARKKRGGFWYCREKERARNRDRYANDPEYRAKVIAGATERNWLSRTWGFRSTF